jgi:hypothetical protein
MATIEGFDRELPPRVKTGRTTARRIGRYRADRRPSLSDGIAPQAGIRGWCA